MIKTMTMNKRNKNAGKLTTQIKYRPLLPSGPDGVEYQPADKRPAKL